jgi:hypothetical protein
LGGSRLTRGSSVRGGYVLRWVRIVLNPFCLYSIDLLRIAAQLGQQHRDMPIYGFVPGFLKENV